MKTPKKYICEIPNCNWEGFIRTTIKNKDSEFYGKKCCPLHAQMYNLPKEKKTYVIPKITSKKSEEKRERRKELDVYFDYHLQKLYAGERCVFCGKKLNASIFNVMHIFPKSVYKSVQNNLDNAIYGCGEIGSTNCHAKFDQNQNNLEYLQSLECLSLILEQVKKVIPFVSEHGRTKEIFDKILENQK